MMDENYHIADVDDIEEDTSSIGEIKRKEKPKIKTKIIYENSDTSNSRDDKRDRNSSMFSFGEKSQEESYNNKRNQNYHDRNDNTSYYESNFHNSEEDGSESKEKEYTSNKKVFYENIISDLYNKRPNTFKATIVGIILALLILWIGILKTLLIFIVVLVANIIGQLLDQNPRLLSVFDYIVRKFR